MAAIVILVSFDGEGHPANAAQLVDPAIPGPSEWRLFAQAQAALEDCAPFYLETPGPVRIEFGADGVLSAVPVSGSSVAYVPQNSGTSQADSAPDRLRLSGISSGPVDGGQWPLAGAADERSLGLSSETFAEVQARLMVAGHDPNGIDGQAGPGTRRAIANWQADNGIPESGYLDEAQLKALRQFTNESFSDWKSRPENAARLAVAGPKKSNELRRSGKAVRASGSPSSKTYRGRDGCLRSKPDNRRGSILLGRSRFCNMRALGLK
ncbi:peptidoglycan-binding protein [Vannielia litorea]|uniref:peptidoglycan-binding domain-containing protein n=1 Tax=Vannielia litorea TaxID=1217970 RepID=UPI001C93FD2A|nr:peptidoglycan-binding domain-containing protein [Vannielia litorea]MBY6153368.1 peptidoglycan-binding protein [Vannielia litorea]